VCKDDSHCLAELKQQKIEKADITFAAHCHNVNVLLSNISLFDFCCFSFSIDSRRRPYNTLALPCECVIKSKCISVRDVPDTRFRFRLAGYPAIFSNPAPAPVPTKTVPGTGYLSRIVFGLFWQFTHNGLNILIFDF